MDLPNTYTSKNETGCCAIPNIQDWDNKQLDFKDKHFIRLHTKSFMYMPINMAKIMKQLNKIANSADAMLDARQVMILSRDLSPWQAEQMISVQKPIDGADNVMLSGTFLSKVFEGPYKEVKNWYQEMYAYAKSLGLSVKCLYFFYTTCPKCAKHYGHNYVIGLAKV